MPDRFEQSFSNLAYAYLQEKALNLLEYLVGFEVVEKDDTGSRGLGILAFKVGTQYMYAPVFFLSGEIKPLELLYVKDKDLFVPLDEDWVDYLLKNKPLELGEGAPRDSQLQFSNPDLSLFATPPMTGKQVMAALASTESMIRALSLQKESSFRALHFIEDSSPMMKRAFLEKARQSVPFLKALLDNYGWGAVKQASIIDAPHYRFVEGDKGKICASCKHFTQGSYCDKYGFTAARGMVCDSWEKDAEKWVGKYASAKILTASSSPYDLRKLPADQREEVMAGGTAFLMNKTAQALEAKLYHTQYSNDLQNPHTTALYEVLTQDGEFVKALVLKDARGELKYGDRKATVVDLKTGKFICAPVSKIWVKKWSGVEEQPDFKDYDSILEQRNTVPLKEGTPNQLYLLLNQNLESSTPFRIQDKITDSNGLVSYLITFEEGEMAYPSSAMPYGTRRNMGVSTDVAPRDAEDTRSAREMAYVDVPSDGIRMIISPKIAGANSKLLMVGDELIVPASFELLPLDKSEEGKSDFRLGSTAVLDQKIRDVVKTANLKVWSPDGMFFTINYENIQARSLEKTAALELLVDRYHINPSVAFSVLGKVESQPRTPVSLLVKQAQGYMGMPDGMMDPRFMSDISVAPGGRQMFDEQLLQSPQSYPPPRHLGGDENMYTGNIGQPGAAPPTNPDLDIGLAMSASDQGDQQIFDHALLGTLARSSEVGELVQKYVPDLESALDKLGRLLFLYWWHHDDFKQLFGLMKLDEIEERIRTVFKDMGHLILELKRKERVRAAEF